MMIFIFIVGNIVCRYVLIFTVDNLARLLMCQWWCHRWPWTRSWVLPDDTNLLLLKPHCDRRDECGAVQQKSADDMSEWRRETKKNVTSDTRWPPQGQDVNLRQLPKVTLCHVVLWRHLSGSRPPSHLGTGQHLMHSMRPHVCLCVCLCVHAFWPYTPHALHTVHTERKRWWTPNE